MLLSELAAMRAADPGAKAVVFSSWGRLLKLVGDALDQVGGISPGVPMPFAVLLCCQLGKSCAHAFCAQMLATSSIACLAPLSEQNGVRHATLAGANPAQREDALHAFLHDPDCVVLTVS